MECEVVGPQHLPPHIKAKTGEQTVPGKDLAPAIMHEIWVWGSGLVGELGELPWWAVAPIGEHVSQGWMLVRSGRATSLVGRSDWTWPGQTIAYCTHRGAGHARLG